MIFEELDDFVGNLALNIMGFCRGKYSRSMPVTKEEWQSVVKWEKLRGEEGSITPFIHYNEEDWK